MNVIACTDKQVSSFINWIQNQSLYPNTTVVILGDHCYLDAPLNNFIKFENKNKSNTQISQSRKFYNVFINSAKQISTDKTKNRVFSSFDMYPTILEALGFEINAEGLALGRSLFNDSKTLLEKYGIETVTSETMKRTIQYESLK
jgi:phosphoglycerol transferase